MSEKCHQAQFQSDGDGMNLRCLVIAATLTATACAAPSSPPIADAEHAWHCWTSSALANICGRNRNSDPQCRQPEIKLTKGEEIVEGVPLLSLGTVTIKDQATVDAMIMQGELSMIWAWKSALAEYSHQLDVHTDGATAFFSGHYKPEVGRPPDAIFHCRKPNG